MTVFKKSMPSMNNPWGLWLLGVLLLVPLLRYLPYHFPVPENVVSAAASAGYSTSHAFYIILLFITGYSLVIWLLTRNQASLPPLETVSQMEVSGRQKFIELALALLLPWLLYFPLFLSRYGPYIEDSYFLSVLNRMHAGQLPYRDFETLYGPLMVYLPYYWTKVFGLSMMAFYSYLCLIESVLYVMIVSLCQKYIPGLRYRLFCILMLAALLFNTLLSPTWNGLRRVFPVLIILYGTRGPQSTRATLGCGLMLGLMMSYSHDYGAACAIGLAAIYTVVFISDKVPVVLYRLVLLGVTSAVIWFLSSWLVLGNLVGDYFYHAVYSMGRYTQEGGFPFYWTLNSLAVFSLLVGSALIIGFGISRSGPLSRGDMFLVGVFVYALIAMRSGMNRSDMWHLVPPVLGLIVWWLLPLKKRKFSPPAMLTKNMFVVIALISFTYFLALAPTGQYYSSGLVRGARDVVTGQPRYAGAATRGWSILPEQTRPGEPVQQLAGYLNSLEMKDRPVLLYSRLWGLDKVLGVVPQTYPLDDFLLSDAAGQELGRYASGAVKPLIIMDEPVYTAIFYGSVDTAIDRLTAAGYFNRRGNTTTMKKILSYMSSIHYTAAPIESAEKEQRWLSTVACKIVDKYVQVAQFDRYVVLDSKRPIGAMVEGGRVLP